MSAELTQFSLTEQLAKVEQMIDHYYTGGEDLTATFHEDVTRYTKVPPGYSEQVKESREERLMDAQKLRQFASDFWDKRKGKPEVK